MKEPREPLPSRRRGTREREPSVLSPSQLLSKSSCFFILRKSKEIQVLGCKGNWCTSRSKGRTLRNGGGTHLASPTRKKFADQPRRVQSIRDIKTAEFITGDAG
nr:uncharacterized protein LOC112696560 isoform X1 [Arachis hypogaea]